MKKLGSYTRWACQYSALCAIKKTLPAIQATLQDVIGQTNAKRKAEARALAQEQTANNEAIREM